MRLRFRQEANCNSPRLLQSYTIARSRTREHAFVLTCKAHTLAQTQPGCVFATQFGFAFCLSKNRMFSQCGLRSLLLYRVCYVTFTRISYHEEAILQIFYQAHDCHCIYTGPVKYWPRMRQVPFEGWFFALCLLLQPTLWKLQQNKRHRRSKKHNSFSQTLKIVSINKQPKTC